MKIQLDSGEQVSWPSFRRAMLASRAGGVSRNPVAAYDQALSGTHQRDAGRDQEEPAGRLSGEYCRATRAFLASNGVDPSDIDAVMAVLDRYTGAEAEEPVEPHVGLIGSDARRRLAQDWMLPPELRRYRPAPMTARQQAAFDERFPHASRIGIR